MIEEGKLIKEINYPNFFFNFTYLFAILFPFFNFVKEPQEVLILKISFDQRTTRKTPSRMSRQGRGKNRVKWGRGGGGAEEEEEEEEKSNTILRSTDPYKPIKKILLIIIIHGLAISWSARGGEKLTL